MVQFALPQNSKVEKGNYFSSKSDSKNIKKINISDNEYRKTFKEKSVKVQMCKLQ